MNNILILVAGGPAGIGVIKSLRKTDFDLNIISIDCDKLSVGLYMSDKHFIVPKVESKSYIKEVLKIVEREKIDKMGGTDITKRLEAAREEFGDDIKAARAVEFGDTKFKEFEDKFGEGQVATTVIDSDGYQRKGSLEKFVKQNPRIAGLKIYDVATNKVVVIVTDTATGRLKLVPADSADIDTTGDTQPTPRENPGLFGQPTKPGRELKEILPDFRDSGFDEDFYQ